jgi:hypothetical protein
VKNKILIVKEEIALTLLIRPGVFNVKSLCLQKRLIYTVVEIVLSWWVSKNGEKYFVFLKPTVLTQFSA